MRARTLTQEQIRVSGLEALLERLGVVGTIRFLQNFETGRGDYTADRRRIIGDPEVRELFDAIRRRRKRGAK